jgi:hypothetical protein
MYDTVVIQHFGFCSFLAGSTPILLVRGVLLSTATLGAGPFVHQILSRFSSPMN